MKLTVEVWDVEKQATEGTVGFVIHPVHGVTYLPTDEQFVKGQEFELEFSPADAKVVVEPAAEERKKEAVTFVMEHGGYDEQGANEIVEEYGVDHILEDKKRILSRKASHNPLPGAPGNENPVTENTGEPAQPDSTQQPQQPDGAQSGAGTTGQAEGQAEGSD